MEAASFQLAVGTAFNLEVVKKESLLSGGMTVRGVTVHAVDEQNLWEGNAFWGAINIFQACETADAWLTNAVFRCGILHHKPLVARALVSVGLVVANAVGAARTWPAVIDVSANLLPRLIGALLETILANAGEFVDPINTPSVGAASVSNTVVDVAASVHCGELACRTALNLEGRGEAASDGVTLVALVRRPRAHTVISWFLDSRVQGNHQVGSRADDRAARGDVMFPVCPASREVRFHTISGPGDCVVGRTLDQIRRADRPELQSLRVTATVRLVGLELARHGVATGNACLPPVSQTSDTESNRTWICGVCGVALFTRKFSCLAKEIQRVVTGYLRHWEHWDARAELWLAGQRRGELAICLASSHPSVGAKSLGARVLHLLSKVERLVGARDGTVDSIRRAARDRHALLRSGESPIGLAHDAEAEWSIVFTISGEPRHAVVLDGISKGCLAAAPRVVGSFLAGRCHIIHMWDLPALDSVASFASIRRRHFVPTLMAVATVIFDEVDTETSRATGRAVAVVLVAADLFTIDLVFFKSGRTLTTVIHVQIHAGAKSATSVARAVIDGQANSHL
jgi:hypothetical protein